ncbi:hypothetical protein DPX16_8226 [Anabarilius grahami]|uniref:Uncharacterized protein n=1 Tax=Anabarilius grahami TaxID=495550 RepID=A0A3N0Y872_ANAGA|nr:hypothetical protein DPX16_8226 [Anabarilius grahami]
MAAGRFGWSREVKASGLCPGLIHYPAPAATHSQPPPKQPFTGSFLLRDSLTHRPALDAWLDHHSSSPTSEHELQSRTQCSRNHSSLTMAEDSLRNTA